jgi:3-hydroxyacyl-CoA dehydrogenase / 3-hydroxy-2-methylbutyryl-CoA dehydrogenase
MTKLKGLICLITGGAGGLGRATAKNLINNGSKVVICDLPDKNDNTLIEEYGENVSFQPTDITSETDVTNAIKHVQNKFGKLNCLINCAGVGTNIKVYNGKKSMPHDLLEFQKIINTNLVGTFNVIRLACELFCLNKPGDVSVVINTSAMSAFDGIIGHAAYSASNGGINSMTLPLSR